VRRSKTIVLALSLAGELLQRSVQWSTPIRNGRFTTRPECGGPSHHRHSQVRPRSVNADSRLTPRAQRPKTRVLYKLAVMVRRCLENKAPKYLDNYCTSVADAASRHRRSANLHHLIVPQYQRSRLGRWAFSVVGPTVWNLLPVELREPALSNGVFRRTLKTILFARY